jgi:hypothetical protein
MKWFRDNASEFRNKEGILDVCYFAEPCDDLCLKIWPELKHRYGYICPCKKWGCLNALKKLNRYLSDYEAKHKKGGR